MKPEQISMLKQFVELLKTKPEILDTPELLFFKEWLVSLGANIPTSQPNRSTEYSVSDDSGADETSESEIEFDDDDKVLPKEDVLDLEMGDKTIEVTDEMIEKADEKKSEAMEKMSEGAFGEAINLFTEAIKLNPQDALLYARRASCFIKMKKPSHAIADCNEAISLNPDVAQPYKWRGFANKMIGNWENAYLDLQASLKLDYTDDAYEAVKEVEPKHKRIFEHNMKYMHKRQEKLDREKRERIRKAREERERAEKETEKPDFEMPNNGNIPDMDNVFSQLFNDPELVSAIQDPEVMKAFSEVCSNPAAMDKYKNNPKVKKVIEKMKNRFGGAGGGMPGGMPFGMGGAGFGMPNQSCPDLD
uniref:Mitochondrial import receptor subunit TOM34 n=1 Tax=Schistosoma japonicum TaxID=6182 RepID=C1L9F4_SCHJA|nr:Mitochondrial import receptor subunit TOM34 [Schistosoma japonicum]